MATQTIRAEYYDTLGSGAIREGNYSWCERVEFSIAENTTERQVVMMAKRELGLTGVICDRSADTGSCIILHPRSSCTAISIEWL
jgi:hypothetical protein